MSLSFLTSEVERKELQREATLAEKNRASPIMEPELLARLLRDIDTLLAEVDRLRKEYELAGEQINELETEEEASSAEIARLRAELDAAAPDESADDIAYEIAETAWKDFGATEEARYPRARLEAAIRKALAERAPPPPAEVEEMRGKLEARVAIIEAFVRKINASPGGEHERLANELRDAASLLSRWPGVWRPIETAPKMKTILLFAVTARDDEGKVSNWKMGSGTWLLGYADRADDLSPWEWNGHRLHKYETQPTHWSPLPEPPHE